MAERIARGWLAILLAKIAIKYRRSYQGRHSLTYQDEHCPVADTYHPEYSGIFSILDSPHRSHELWLARFDGRDESKYLSAALMRAPVRKIREYADEWKQEYVITWDLSALLTVVDYLKAQRLSNWGWLNYSSDEYPEIWHRELEILNGPVLLPV